MVDSSRLVQILPERVGEVTSPHFPHNLDDGKDYSWSLETFKSTLQARITRMSDWRIELDLIGLDASVANAIRRVLIAEVPTVAIEEVYMHNNTSIIVDEVLSHRVGMVPLKFEPDLLMMREKGVKATDRNTIVFNLKAKCERVPGTTPRDGAAHLKNGKVLSSAFVWQAAGSQEEDWGEERAPRPVHNGILLAKLRPGQEIDMQVHCIKGVGKDHAKFSPVSTASYRLLPHINIPDPLAIESEDIPKFVGCFPPGVIGVRKHKVSGLEEVFVKNARKDTVSREVLRYKEFDGKVKLGRVRDHFLFDIESSGAMKPEMLLPAAIEVLLEKIRKVRKGVEAIEERHGYDSQG